MNIKIRLLHTRYLIMEETGTEKMRISWELAVVKFEENIYKQERYRATKMCWNDKMKDKDQYSRKYQYKVK